MSEESDENSEVYNHYLELSKPTQEDFERTFTEEELQELCLKHKCRVDMYRWNVVNDYRILFTESGRYQRWSERDRLGMLTKAVNKMKPSVLYGDEEIIKTRKEEWGFQLKENILSLNFWHRKRNKEPRLEILESGDIDQEVQSQCEVNTESMTSSALYTQSEILPTESMSTEEPPESRPITDREVTKARSTQSEEADILLAYFEQENLTKENSEDSIETVLHNMHERKLVVEAVHSEQVAPEIENIYGINTVSMSIDSQMSTQDLPILKSEDVIPGNDGEFKNNTQSKRKPTMCRAVDQEVQLEIEVNTESMNMSELLTQSEQQREFEQDVHLQIPAHTESANTEDLPENRQITDREITPTRSSQGEQENILLSHFDEEYLTEEGSSDSTQTVLHKEHHRKLVKTLHSEKVAPEIENMYGINTVSMTIDSQMSSQDLPILKSQDVIPANDGDFKNTKSQRIQAIGRALDEEVQFEIEVNTESMNVSELLTQPQQQIEFEQRVQSQISAHTESKNTEDLPETRPIVDREVTTARSSQGEEENILLSHFDEEYLTEEGSGDSIETVLNEHYRKLVVETLHSEEVAPEIENIYGINTVSMSIDSQMSTQDLQILQSQDVTPPNYDKFKNSIPSTSTQSENHDSEYIIGS